MAPIAFRRSKQAYQFLNKYSIEQSTKTKDYGASKCDYFNQA